MKILVTGKYEPEYNRNIVLLRGLEKSGIELVEFPYIKRNRETAAKLKKLALNCDLVFLPSFTHLDVPFVRRLTDIPLVFDPLISRYLSKVFDYKTVWRYSPRALKNYLKDFRAFRRSDLILADTDSHKDYYVSEFGVDPAKIVVVRVGVLTSEYFPKPKERIRGEKIIIGFYGSFIPLHGLDKIIAAAKILEGRADLEFRIFGSGMEFNRIQELSGKLELKNTIFKGWIDYKLLNDAINDMDICLGIFGDSLKAELVIPNKIYHYAACRKPIITADTKGIKEVFENGENIILTENNPASLAKSIINLADNKELQAVISANVYELVCRDFNEEKIGGEFLEGVKKLFPTGV